MNAAAPTRAACVLPVLAALLLVLAGPALAGERPVGVAVSTGAGSGELVLRFRLSAAPGVHVYATEDHFLAFRVDRSEGLGAPRLDTPPASRIPDGDGGTTEAWSGDVELRAVLPFLGPEGGPWSLAGSLSWQACTDLACFPPESFPVDLRSDGQAGQARPAAAATAAPWEALLPAFRETGRLSGYADAEGFLAFLEGRAGPAAEETGAAGGLGTLLFYLLAGLALNLTPCVLPLIPLNLALIGAGAGTGRLRGLAVGGTYGAGMALAYGGLGAAVIAGGARFGDLNASPAFNFTAAGIFALLGLAMAGAVDLDLSRFRGRTGAGGGRFLAAFLLGALSALLAGACVAPVVVAVVLHGTALYAAGNAAGLLLPLLLGLGMALPWPLAGAGLAVLPRPGRWMVVLKLVFSALILGMAAWYAWTGAWLLRERARAPDPAAALVAGLERSLASGRPLLLEFGASWCKNCAAMERGTLVDARVAARLGGLEVARLRLEQPDRPEERALLERFGVVGLPAFVVLERTGGR